LTRATSPGGRTHRLVVAECDAALVTSAAEIVASIVEALESRGAAVLDETHARMAEVVPALDIAAHPELAAVVEASSRASLEVMLAALRGGRPPTAMPPAALAEARVCAALGIPVGDLLQTYRRTHADTWEAAIEQVEAADARAEDRAEALRVFARVLYGYLDLASASLPEEHRRAAVTRAADAGRRRLDAVRAVLSGGARELRGIAYDLRREHVALIAWGDAPEEALAAAASAPSLVVAVDDGLAWGWAGAAVGSDGLADRLPGATSLALGEPGRGAGGFRSSHEQAARAQAVAARTGARVARYREVALEAFALAEPAEARGFVVAELGPLLGDDPHAPRLRETLAAYLASGQSAATAAARLRISDRTAAYRVRAAEERLGHPVHARAAEIAVALRWARLLELG
jgi:PucR C-terminal helix-turn-helix domain